MTLLRAAPTRMRAARRWFEERAVVRWRAVHGGCEYLVMTFRVTSHEEKLHAEATFDAAGAHAVVIERTGDREWTVEVRFPA